MPTIPPAQQCQVWLDFDGTLTRSDLLDELIGRYSFDDSWKLIEEQWRRGEIGSRQCLEFEFSLLRMSEANVSSELAAVELDPGTVALIQMLDGLNVPTAILSDGVDRFIREILGRTGVRLPHIRANAVDHAGDRMTFRCPFSSATCTSSAAHCKCASREVLREPARKCIYVGDGRSDLCVSQRCDIVFAKGALAQSLQALGVPFVRFDTLIDVRRMLTDAWSIPGDGSIP